MSMRSERKGAPHQLALLFAVIGSCALWSAYLSRVFVIARVADSRSW
jgi:hypothetical protein